MVNPPAPSHPARMHKILLPLIAWVLFTAFSVSVVIEHGFADLIPIHTAGGWPTQVFTDLVLAALCFLTLAVPDARRRGIDVRPYFVATLALGSIGALAYLVRRQLGAAGRVHDAR
jgi:hypothetical protein